MSVDNVNDIEPRDQYTASAAQTEFDYTFPIFEDGDLVVYVDGALQALTTDYTVTGEGDDAGGTITFLTAMTGGEVVTIYRDLPIERTTDFQTNGPNRSSSMNDELDRMTMVMQQLKRDGRRAIRFTLTSDVGSDDLELNPTSYANKYLAFDADGKPEPVALSAETMTRSTIGELLYPITAAEIAAGVTIVQFNYEPGYIRRYGNSSTGNGVQDDTTAVNAAIAVLNAGGKRICGYPGDTYICSGLTTVTANDTFWWFTDSTIKVKADSWLLSGDGTTHLNISGQRPRLYGLTLDGNQASFTAAPIGRLLQVSDDLRALHVTLKNSAYQGLRSSGTRGQMTDCHIDDNANLGMELQAASYWKFNGTTFDRNGYGYQQTMATNAFAAFGVAIRYRSHHIDFISCSANQNGRDGIAIGQGSYAIKQVAVTTWMNGDGGQTIHADNTGTGLPGESEACYDLEYVDCESYNNWGGGLVGYAAAYNVTVTGGRYYNNNRLAGTQAMASSYPNGIYFAGGSLGIKVDTKAYDDRQLCAITAVSGTSPRTLTATGWVSGTSSYYPRVALYNAAMVFQGYGNISSESAGSVVITTTASNGVTLANIAAGWFVTQRVQHNGCFADNACQGSIIVDGFGQLPGPANYMGWKTISGFNAGGQNILLPSQPLDYTELLLNPTFDSNVANWTFNLPGGGAANYYTTANNNRRSAGSLQLIACSSYAVGYAALNADYLRYAYNAWVEASIWCYANGKGDAYFSLFWNPGSIVATTVVHPGGGWRLLKICGFMAAGITQIFPRVNAAANKTTYWDNASLRIKTDPTDNNDYTYPTRNLTV